MADGICTVPECEKPLGRTRADLCEMHYMRRYRGGTLEKRRQPRTCRECDRPAFGNGLCQRHYARVRRADPQRPRCAQERCERATEARGYCGYHFSVNFHEDRVRANRATPEARERVADWQRRNPDRMAELRSQWKAANRELVREASRRHSSIRRARKYGAEWEKIDFAELLAAHGMICHLCGGQIDEDLEWDHVIPLARGGAHAAENLRPSHALCNRRKGARLTA